MNYPKCINCGADRGIHHGETMQCPVGGFEAHYTQKQYWAKTVYVPDSRSDSESERIRQLEKRVFDLEQIIKSLTD